MKNNNLSIKEITDAIFIFSNFSAEHWRHIRAVNPKESTFATVKLRTTKAGGYFSHKYVLSLTFKLYKLAVKNYIKLHQYKKLRQLIKDAKYVNGIEQERNVA